MDRFKWYSSKSVMMDNIALGEPLFRKSFLKEAFEVFDSNKKGINSLLFLYMRMNTRSNPNHYEIFFSVDGKLMEIKDLNPLVDGDPFYVVDISTGKRVNNSFYDNAMSFILEFIVQRDGLNIRSQLSQFKSVVALQVDFDDFAYTSDEMTGKLRTLFNKHFVDVIGPMSV